jgi:hypothetical protein
MVQASLERDSFESIKVQVVIVVLSTHVHSASGYIIRHLDIQPSDTKFNHSLNNLI